MSSFIRQRALTIAQQAAAVRAEWPSLHAVTNGEWLEVRGVLQPTPVSAEYDVGVVYRLRFSPKAYVYSPPISRRAEAPETRIPHTYPAPDGAEERPCLYRPWSNEWCPAKLVSRTIVPWLMTWLVDYEVWRATGQWLGGGAPHGRAKTDAL